MAAHKSRENKKKALKHRQESVRLDKKLRLERVLSVLGLLQGFRELPSAVREVAIAKLPARQKLVIVPTAQASPTTAELKQRIEQALDGETIPAGENKTVPLLDFLSICRAVPMGFLSITKSDRLSQEQRVFVEQAGKFSAAYYQEKKPKAVESLNAEIMIQLLSYSRIDTQLFGCVLSKIGDRQARFAHELTLYRSEPRVIHVVIHGERHRAYQWAFPTAFEGIKWVECDGAVFGLEHGRNYPIFLQSHALRRLRERLAASLITEVTLQQGLMFSLIEPNVVERQEDGYLIEFHLGGTRVGYLVARVNQDTILVNTFLLLTMSGTPENRLLRHKLGLTRRDIEYEGLDRLETFLAPDILADEQLVRVLEECGCGPLLTLARDGFPHKVEDSRAEELKRFLRITNSNEKLSKRLQ
jgi:hypothetical protein